MEESLKLEVGDTADKMSALPGWVGCSFVFVFMVVPILELAGKIPSYAKGYRGQGTG
jgi:hypothetical protein